MAKRNTGQLEEWTATVKAALALCDSDQADALIKNGEAGGPAEHGSLLRAGQALYSMVWAMAKGAGMRETVETRRMGAQGLAMLETLIHYAYALGVRRGRGDDFSGGAQRQHGAGASSGPGG